MPDKTRGVAPSAMRLTVVILVVEDKLGHTARGVRK
jgi:hypothetical protein